MTFKEYLSKQQSGSEATQTPDTGIQSETAPATKPAEAPTLPEEYKRVYRAVYAYHARHNAPFTDDEWKEAAKDIGRVASSLGNTQFAITMLGAVYAEWERLAKIRKGQQ